MAAPLAHSMRCAPRKLCVVLFLVAAVVTGCGSGSSNGTGGAPDFSVGVSASSVNITSGSSATFQITTQPLNGFSGNVTITVSNEPAGVTTTPASPITISVGTAQTVTVNCASTTAAGTYDVTLNATSGSLSHSARVSLTVVVPSFTLSVSPATLSVTAGDQASFQVSLQPVNGFIGTAQVQISGLPSGVTVSPGDSFSLTPASPQTVTINAASGTTGGTYTLSIAATSGTLNSSAILGLTIVAPSFALGVTPPTLSVTAGNQASFQVSLQPVNGFIGTAQVQISGLPSGVTLSPGASFSLTAASPQTVTVASDTLPGPGSYPLTLTATSGTITASATESLSVQPQPFPGDYFFSPPTTEFGSTFAGNVVYDSNLKEVFFGNPAMNEVEVYSTVDGHRVGAVTVPGVVGLSLAPDGSELAVGTSTPHVYFVDPVALHVTGQVEVPPSVLNPETGLEPVLPFLMATGPMLIEEADGNSIVTGEGNLLSYDPVSGAFAVVNPPGAYIGIYGGTAARSLDGNYLAVPTLGQTALQMSIYSAASQTYIGSTPGQYNLRSVAANPDGSQFATVGTPSYTTGGQYITFWSRSLQQQAQYETQDLNVLYSRDGKYLYAGESTDVLAINAQTGTPAGYQGLVTATMEPGTLWDTDENDRVYGISDLGAYTSSVAQLQSTAPAMPWFLEALIGSSIGNPNEGPLTGGTQVQFTPNSIGTGSADGLDSTMEAYFGSIPAPSDAVAPYSASSDGGNFLTATTPSATSTGPVTVLIADANNNAVLLPGAFSYGPHSRWIDPSAVSANGGTVSTMFADGIVSLEGVPSNVTVTVGGASAVTAAPSIVGGNSESELSVTMPTGKPGWANLDISLPDGTSETTQNMVQYLTQDVTLTSPAYTSAVYDSSRDLFYLTGADNTVGVFNPETRALLQPMQSSSISAGAVLGSLALLPDNSKLLVTDPTDHSLVVFDLTTGASTAVNVLVASDGAATVSAPMPVAALSGNKALVLLTPWSKNEMREIDLSQMTVQVRTDLQSAGLFSIPPSTMMSSQDGSVALLGGETPGSPTTYFAWEYESASDTFSAPTTLSYSQEDSVAVNSDGTVLGVGGCTLDQSLLPLVPFQFIGVKIVLTGSGALRFSAAGQVEVSDTHNGRPLLSFEPLPAWATTLAVDPTGQKILVGAGTSLRYYQLTVIPLAVAGVSPAQASPGASLTVHGNGFVAGTTATIAGKSAACTLVDSQTLQCTVPNLNSGLAPMTLNNPDGQTYSLEAAVNVE